MLDTIIDLKLKFDNIKKRGWIESISRGNGNVGITLENKLGKERENLPIADYEGIEIKTNIKEKSRPYITLFSAAPDGKYIYQTKILKDKYGIPDKIYKEYKILYARVNSKNYKKINNIYMKLNVNYKEQKIILEIYNKNYKLIENDCFWDFDTIEKKINTKIKYLAYISASKKYENQKVYFYYKDIKFYKIKSIKQFLYLIDIGMINICFKVGFYKQKDKFGNTYDHGTGFEIKKENLIQLYNEIKL